MNIKLLYTSLIIFISGNVFAQPVNDDPCNAIPVLTTSTCSYIQFDNIGATGTTGIADPICGNYNGEDVWFVTIVPPSGIVNLEGLAGSLSNINAAIYTATSCTGPFTEIGCDLTSSLNGTLPFLQLVSLIPGDVIYIRVWDNYEPPVLPPSLNGDPLEQGTFSICLFDGPSFFGNFASYNCVNTPPAGDDCLNATAICTFDGYCGSTQGYTDQSWSELDNIFCGSIENNSFLVFEASSPSITLNVDVSPTANDCETGIQFLMYSADQCGGANVVDLGCESPMNVGSNTFTGTGLVAGETYYLMVDGWAGDVCDYIIHAVSGIGNSLSVGGDQVICLGNSANIKSVGQNGSPVNWTGQFLNQATGDSVICAPTSVGTYMIIGEAPALVNNCGGVVDTMFVTVVEESDIQVTASLCDTNGNVTLTATGGTDYMWEPPVEVSQTSGNLIQVNPAVSETYYVYGQFGNSCIDSSSVLVFHCDSCVIPIINISSLATICEPGSVDLGSAVGNPDGNILSYYISLSDAQNGTNELMSTSIDAIGTMVYFVRAEYPNNSNCFSIEQIIVTINPLPTIGAPSDFTTCPNVKNLLNAFNPDGAVIAWDNGVLDGVEFYQTTIGVVTYTVTGTLNGCVSTDSIDITLNPPPTLVVDGGNLEVICPGDSVLIEITFGTANDSVAYRWEDESGNVLGTSSSINLSPNSTQWFYIYAFDQCYSLEDSVLIQLDEFDFTNFAITNADGCPPANQNDNGEVVITVNPSLSLNYEMAQTISPLSSATQIGGVTGNQFVDIVGGIPYEIIATNPITGCSIDSIIVIGLDNNSIAFTSPTTTDINCPGDGDGSAMITNISGGSGNVPYDIMWTSPAGGVDISGTIPSIPASASENSLIGGTWSVTVTDDAGCSWSEVFYIYEPDAIDLGIVTSSPLCYGASNGSLQMNSDGGTLPYIYEIFDTDNALLNVGNSNEAFLIPLGWYHCQITDDNGCIESDSVFIDQPSDMYITLSLNPIVCYGDSNGTATAQVFNNQGPVTMLWSPSGETDLTVSQLSAGTISFSMEDSVGCTYQNVFLISNPDSLYFDSLVAVNSYCRGNGVYSGSGSVSGLGAGGVVPYSYQWDGNGETTNVNSWSNRVPSWYTLTITDNNGCSITDSIYVDSLNPIADFSISPMSGAAPLTVTIADNSQNRVTNTWDIDLGSSFSLILGYDSLQTPFDTTYTNPGIYDICLIVSNDFECYDTTCIEINVGFTSVEELEDTDIKIYPNPVSDKLYIEGVKGAGFDVDVLDMRGKIVFKSSNKTVVDISNLSRGEYIVRIIQDEKTITKAIIKE